MQRSHISDPPTPPVGRRPCPICGLPMFVSHIEPPDDADDERIFECAKCAYSETAVTEFR
jgi:hypothetical protein